MSQDQDYRSYPLPRMAQQVEIGEKAELIAKVDLGSLGLRTRIRRSVGEFPKIYVLNYAARPLDADATLTAKLSNNKP